MDDEDRALQNVNSLLREIHVAMEEYENVPVGDPREMEALACIKVHFQILDLMISEGGPLPTLWDTAP